MTKPPKPNDHSGADRVGGEKSQPHRGELPRWFREAQHARSADARSAWSTFLKMTRHDNPKGSKLTLEDRTEIARRFHLYYRDNKAQLDERGVTIGHLCRVAFDAEDSKEWYRLSLPEGIDPLARGIRADGWKYRLMIEAFSAALGDSREQIADLLLRNTSLDPYRRPTEDLTALERVQASLSRIVHTIDSEFGLFDTYRQTAELKRIEIEGGGTLCWPFYNLELLAADDPSLTAEEIQVRLETATDPRQAYYQLRDHHGRPREGEWWSDWHDCGHLQNDEFFYVPHAPIGHALIWDLPYRRNDPMAYNLAVHQQLESIRSNQENLKLPKDDWDEVANRPVGQTMSRGDIFAALQYHFWLLAYPHPDGRGVVPTLFLAGEEGGAYITPLDMDAIEMLGDAVWVSPDSHESMLERLTYLLTDGSGDQEECSIERALKRTAPWLHHNPVLKRHQAQMDRSRALDRYLRRT